jgi:hypothetical protein
MLTEDLLRLVLGLQKPRCRQDPHLLRKSDSGIPRAFQRHLGGGHALNELHLRACQNHARRVVAGLGFG